MVEAVSQGGELEFDATLSREFTLHENLGYTAAAITAAGAGAAFAVGSPLPNVPKWTVNSSPEYSSQFGNGWGLGCTCGRRVHRIRIDPNGLPYPVTERGSYNLVGAHVVLMVNRLSAWLYVENLLNRVAFVGFDHSEAQNTPQYVRAIPTVPRTIG